MSPLVWSWLAAGARDWGSPAAPIPPAAAGNRSAGLGVSGNAVSVEVAANFAAFPCYFRFSQGEIEGIRNLRLKFRVFNGLVETSTSCWL